MAFITGAFIFTGNIGTQVNFTNISNVVMGALTADIIHACAPIQAGGLDVTYMMLALDSDIGGSTCTLVAINTVRACSAIFTWVTDAFIYVYITELPC